MSVTYVHPWCEIRNGAEVTFRDGTETRRGTVNAAPWVLWNGDRAVTMVPVYVRDGDDCLHVFADNLITVEAHSVKA